MDIDKVPPKDNIIMAELKKTKGNTHFEDQKYKSAIIYYTEAINIRPDVAEYYANRSACYMKLKKYNRALLDAKHSILLDIKCEKGYVVVVKCYLALGDYNEADDEIRKFIKIYKNSVVLKNEKLNCLHLKYLEDKIQLNYENQNFCELIPYLNRGLKISPACIKYQLLKSESLTYLGYLDEATKIIQNVMVNDSTSTDAIYIHGLILYYQYNIYKAIIHFKYILQLDPDHKRAKEMHSKLKELKIKIEYGKNAFNYGKFRKAFKLYTDALIIDPFNKNMNCELYYNRALVSYKMNNINDTILDCTTVLNINLLDLKTILLRAKCYKKIEKYDECVKDYQTAFQINKALKIKILLRKAKFALKKAKLFYYCKLLGVRKTASDQEIMKAYRKKALAHHPDRHANLSDTAKMKEETKFKEIGKAYAILYKRAIRKRQLHMIYVSRN